MNKSPSRIFLCLPVMALLACSGCANLAKNAYTGAVTVPIAVEAARVAYIQHANICNCVHSNEYLKVQGYFQSYQAAAASLEAAVGPYGTNEVPNSVVLQALTDAALSTAGDYISIITQLIPPPEAAKLKTKVPKAVKIQ